MASITARKLDTRQQLAEFVRGYQLSIAELLTGDGQSKPGAWWRAYVSSGPPALKPRLTLVFARAGRTVAWAYLEDVLNWASTMGNVDSYQADLTASGLVSAVSNIGRNFTVTSGSGRVVVTPPAIERAPVVPYQTVKTRLLVNDHPLLVGSTGVAIYARSDRSTPSINVEVTVSHNPMATDRFGAPISLTAKVIITPDRGHQQSFALSGVLGAGPAFSPAPEITRTIVVPASYKSRKGMERSGLVTVVVGLYVPKVMEQAKA